MLYFYLKWCKHFPMKYSWLCLSGNKMSAISCMCEPSGASLWSPPQNKPAGWVPYPHTKIWGAPLVSVPT